MNCQVLEGMAHDLARDQMMDASLREKALVHAGSCECCGARLADERALTAGLQRVASMTEEAPVRVETALLAAFREQRQALPVSAPAVTVTPVARRRWLYAAAGIAAAAVIVMFLTLMSSRNQDTRQPAPQRANSNEGAAPAVPNEPGPQTTQPATPTDGPRQIAESVHLPRHAGRQDRAGIKPDRKPERLNGATDDLNRSAGEAEIATDFIPLMSREALAQLDGGQVMRVELPRSALMSFGLPMDMERATERIKADVVVGNDGLARAIRFVR